MYCSVLQEVDTNKDEQRTSNFAASKGLIFIFVIRIIGKVILETRKDANR